MYAGSGTSYFDLSLEPMQELFVTLVTIYRVCPAISVTLHKSLFGHFGDLTQEFDLNSPERWITGPVISPFPQDQLSARFYRASYWSRPTGPVIGLFLQGQLSVQTCRASYRSRSTGPVIGLDLQDQWSVHIFRASDRSIILEPEIGSFLQDQLSVHFFSDSYRSISVSLDIGQVSSASVSGQ